MKHSNSVGYTLWAAAIIVCLLASLFALIFSSCAKPKNTGETGKNGFVVETAASAGEADAPPPAQTETPETPVPENTVRLAETADAGHEYLDKFVFLGDSTTYGIGYYYNQGYTELCPFSQVWTPKSGTLTLSYYNIVTIDYTETGEELTIEEAVRRTKPEYLMITLGVNGVSFMDEEWFIRDYTALVRMIQQTSRDTKIILNSIYPVATTYKWISDINNDKIRAANGWIEQVAADTGVRYLYSYECLVGPDGNLPEEASNGDGIHLSGESFVKVMEYVRTHAYQ